MLAALNGFDREVIIHGRKSTLIVAKFHYYYLGAARRPRLKEGH
jgi:hypothetical protein